LSPANLQDLLQRLDAGDDGCPRLTKADDLDFVTRGAQAKPTKTQVCADNNFYGRYHAPVANKSDF
jgi:hypothetical protein